jgi:hypothetical protein
MSLRNALIKNVKSMKELKKVIDEQNEQTKIEIMLEEQRKLLEQYDNDIVQKEGVFVDENVIPVKEKKPKKYFDESVLQNGGHTHYQLNSKWYRISVLTNDNESDITKYKFHTKNGHDNTVFVSAKTYADAQGVIDSIYGKGMYKVSGVIV